MKNLVLIISLFSIHQVFSQIISGDLYSVGRRLLTETNFSIKAGKNGEVVFDISVDINGKVTSAVIDKSKSNVTSTPMIMDAKNLLSTFKFEAGTGFPKFHHGLVKINFTDK